MERKAETDSSNTSDAKVGAIMTPDPEVLYVDHSVTEAAARMRDLDVGLMFVCDGDQVVGALSDRDICCRGAAEGLDPQSTSVQRVMTKHVVYCSMDETPAQALKSMERDHVRRLAVANDEGALVGIVSLGDLARAESGDNATSHLIQSLTEPMRPAKTPRRPIPTGGRAVPPPKGGPGTYSTRPRLAPGAGRHRKNGEIGR